jgi:hypothetical protein
MEHPYTDFYTVADVARELEDFIRQWKQTNFLRRQNQQVTDVLTARQLSVATSGKRNGPYTLYRGFARFTPGDFYTDQFPSSWSTSIDVARRFGSACVVALEVPCTSVLLDLELLRNDAEHEVILLPGTYAPVLVDRNRLPAADGLRARLQAVPDADLRLMCLDRGLSDKGDRPALVSRLAQHLNETQSEWTDRAALSQARKMGL